MKQQDDEEKTNSCTTAFFEGQAAVMDPRDSWVAKWLRVDSYLPGVYASEFRHSKIYFSINDRNYSTSYYILTFFLFWNLSCSAKYDEKCVMILVVSLTGQFKKETEEELANRGCSWRCRPVGGS